jgi:hypothetical protein
MIPKAGNKVTDRPFADGRALRSIAATWLAILLILLAGSLVNRDFITLQFLARQDMWLLTAQVILASFILVTARKSSRELHLSRVAMLLIVGVIVVLCYVGHHWILLDHDLIRDEQMVRFDEAIYAHGRLAWPLPSAWQRDAGALNTMFMLPGQKPVAWVSSYLPMNAAIRAALGAIVDPALAGPLYTGLSVPLLWACARRIWPNDREIAIVPVLLFACSGQFLIMGMTVYAMPAHLFFNLLWLCLFLIDRRGTDMAMLLVGFVATGLHQPLFHPMFVAPFLLLVLLQRRWSRLGLFIAGYAVICAFWLTWPHYIHTLVSAPGPAFAPAPAGTDYWARLLGALGQNKYNLQLMADNLLRFCTWQHILLLPLMLASWNIVRKDRMAGALALGFVLPIAVMAIILPWQGVGFGYRYVHGVLGNAALLGGYGWQQLVAWRAQLRTALLQATTAGVMVLIPMQVWMVHRLYAPYAMIDARIDASGTDYIVIGIHDAIWADSLVINRPDLSNRPIRLYVQKIEHWDELASRICKSRARVALPTDKFFEPMSAIWGKNRPHSANDRLPGLSALFRSKGCNVKVLQ